MPIEIVIREPHRQPRARRDRERRSLLHKLNMVIGAFFSEVGTELLGRLRAFDASFEHTRPHLMFRPDWSAEHAAAAEDALRALEPDIDLPSGDADGLRAFLTERRRFLLRLLETPTSSSTMPSPTFSGPSSTSPRSSPRATR